MKYLTLFSLLLSFNLMAEDVVSGKAKAFISPDNELVIELYGDAGSKTDKFFKPIKKPLSKNLLRAGLSVRERLGIRKGLRKGVRVGTNVRAEASVPVGVRKGVSVGVREQNVKLGIRVGMIRAEEAMVRVERASIRMARRAGLRETMSTIMNIRANGVRDNRSIVYRMVFKNVDANPTYPRTGKATVERTGGNSLVIDFDPTLSKTMQELKGLLTDQMSIDCYSSDSCKLSIDL